MCPKRCPRRFRQEWRIRFLTLPVYQHDAPASEQKKLTCWRCVLVSFCQDLLLPSLVVGSFLCLNI